MTAIMLLDGSLRWVLPVQRAAGSGVLAALLPGAFRRAPGGKIFQPRFPAAGAPRARRRRAAHPGTPPGPSGIALSLARAGTVSVPASGAGTATDSCALRGDNGQAPAVPGAHGPGCRSTPPCSPGTQRDQGTRGGIPDHGTGAGATPRRLRRGGRPTEPGGPRPTTAAGSDR